LPDTIELYSNLNEKLSSTEAAKKYKCASLVSGGFYTTEFRHVGLFYNNGDLASREIKHNVFDGFIISTKDNSLYISKTPPKDYENLKLALQAGPIIYYNRKPTTISSEASKERARRIVAATTQDGDIIFMVLKSKNNPLDGPTLDELPKLIDTISNQKSFNIEAAINLDGGSHSSFLTGTSNTYEVSTIGSFFCIKI
jgi:exopolysaccharide biosynthesis protein